ncbi:hypothetical protein D9Q98_002901 [Chlorella vulgaris]|uniref:Fatty acid desaturase domain-containing protein n=1 Tax=Chlorella vulgaris TaxID=3077 RepID=A0A9D4TUC8_CHLVU|nr:hypothetical protein D9Q98_002901 [Chlorella vulgaris]
MGLQREHAASLLHAPEAKRLLNACAADAAAARAEFLWAPPAALHKPLAGLLEDPRDLPILFLYLNVLLSTAPAVAALFWGFPAATRPLPHLLGATYLVANYVAYLGRFMLSLHYSQHRRLFKRGLWPLNLLAPVLLAPLFGVPSGMYHIHHCLMHHCGNNQAGLDGSSTERYQRDSLLAFLRYWLRFALGGWLETPLRCLRYRRWRLLLASVACEAAYFGLMVAAWRANPRAALWVLLVPYAVTSLALMFGNWSQHVFVDPQQPGNPYRLTYNCAGVGDNARSYNDGYHVLHHLNSQLHWSELPAQFAATLEQHAAHDALCFVGISFFEIGAAVMAGKYAFLLRHLSRYSTRLAAMDDAQLTALLKSRLAPFKGC